MRFETQQLFIACCKTLQLSARLSAIEGALFLSKYLVRRTFYMFDLVSFESFATKF